MGGCARQGAGGDTTRPAPVGLRQLVRSAFQGNQQGCIGTPHGRGGGRALSD